MLCEHGAVLVIVRTVFGRIYQIHRKQISGLVFIIQNTYNVIYNIFLQVE